MSARIASHPAVDGRRVPCGADAARRDAHAARALGLGRLRAHLSRHVRPAEAEDGDRHARSSPTARPRGRRRRARCRSRSASPPRTASGRAAATAVAHARRRRRRDRPCPLTSMPPCWRAATSATTIYCAPCHSVARRRRRPGRAARLSGAAVVSHRAPARRARSPLLRRHHPRLRRHVPVRRSRRRRPIAGPSSPGSAICSATGTALPNAAAEPAGAATRSGARNDAMTSPVAAPVGAVAALARRPAAARRPCRGFWSRRKVFFAAWLAACWFDLGIVARCAVWLWIHRLTGGRWGDVAAAADASPRRALAARAGALRAAGVSRLPCSTPGSARVPAARRARRPAAPSSTPGMRRSSWPRAASLYALVWLALARRARRPLPSGDAAASVMLHLVVTSLAAVDLLAALVPDWSSSIFGLLALAGPVLRRRRAASSRSPVAPCAVAGDAAGQRRRRR